MGPLEGSRMEWNTLSAGELHLWTVETVGSDEVYQAVRGVLAEDELVRADRFHADLHRRRFVFGRAALRILVGQYTCTDARAVRFCYGAQGKPALADVEHPLRFNASNSGDLAAFVFATGCEVGVDIEQHRAVSDLSHIAERFFSREEADELAAVPEPDRKAAFFRCWTRKEAFIKALGGGFSIPLGSFRVAFRSDEEARLLAIEGSAERAREWQMHDFDPGADYAGAVIYSGAAREISKYSMVINFRPL